MSFTSPKTWASGYVVLASDLNTYIRDNQNMTAPAIMTSQGDLLIASGANTPIRLAKSTTSTQYLANTGSSNNPAWNEVALDTGVSGTLPVGNGGTGATTFTANNVILVGNTTSAVTATATMATKGHLMVGDGSGVPSMLAVGTNDYVLTAASGEGTGIKWAEAAGGETVVTTLSQFARVTSTTRATMITPTSSKKIRIVSVDLMIVSDATVTSILEVYFGTGANIESTTAKAIAAMGFRVIGEEVNSTSFPTSGGPIGAVDEVVSIRVSAGESDHNFRVVIHYAEE